MKKQTKNKLSGVSAIVIGLSIIGTVNQQSDTSVVNRVTGKIDHVYCVSLSEASYNVNQEIHQCMLEAKAERQTHSFL